MQAMYTKGITMCDQVDHSYDNMNKEKEYRFLGLLKGPSIYFKL